MRYLVIILFLVGCEHRGGYDYSDKGIDDRAAGRVFEIVYDGCQYLAVRKYPNAGLRHKGNCTNH